MVRHTPCTACAHSYMGPGDEELVCGHVDAGAMGIYARRAREDADYVPLSHLGVKSPAVGHCGPEATKFEQHPDRTESGGFKR